MCQAALLPLKSLYVQLIHSAQGCTQSVSAAVRIPTHVGSTSQDADVAVGMHMVGGSTHEGGASEHG